MEVIRLPGAPEKETQRNCIRRARGDGRLHDLRAEMDAGTARRAAAAAAQGFEQSNGGQTKQPPPTQYHLGLSAAIGASHSLPPRRDRGEK